MDTSPLLARREIPRKERLQKALVVVLVTVLAVAGAWMVTNGSPDNDPVYFFVLGLLALPGLCVAAYFWLKTEEAAHTKEESQYLRDRIEDDRQGRGWIGRIGYNTRRFLSGLIILGGFLVVLAGLGVLSLQIYGYLRVGEWKSVSLLASVAPFLPWLDRPQSWFGLNKILREASGIMPLSLALVLVGGLIAGFGSAVRERVTR